MKKFKLTQIASIENGGTPSTEVAEYWNGDIPWITPFDLSKTNSKWIKQGSRNITKEGVRNSNAKIVPARSIMVSTRAPIGYIVLNEVEATTNQGMKSVIPNAELVDTEYLYYLLKTKVKEMNLRAGGTTFKEISTNTFKGLEVNLPCIEEQKIIGRRLSKIDEKIEMNNLLMSNLEEYSKLLFHKWFVDFNFPNENGEPYKVSGGEMVEENDRLIPENFSLSTIGKFATLNMGVSPKSDSYNESNIGLPLLNGAGDFSEGIIVPSKYTTDSQKKCEQGDIIFCIRGTIGYVTIADSEYSLGRGVASVIPKNKALRNMLYYTIKKDIDTLSKKASGSIIKGLTKDDISKIEVNVPPQIVLDKFNLIASPIIEKIEQLKRENRSLVEMRDLLINKLIK